MLRLAVATREETFERLRDPLAERDIRVDHVRAKERTLDLSAPGDEFDGFDAGFVYPTRPMEGGVVDALLDVPWVNDREAILTSRNKAGVVAALSRAGVPTPRTTLVSNPVGESAVAEAVAAFGADGDTDVVVKPNSTTRGIGVVRVGDVDSALGVTDYLDLVHDYKATGDRSYLLQEYLPDARDYRAMVVDGECVGGVERRLSDEDRAAGKWKHNVHRGAEATGVDLPSAHRELAERTAAVLGIRYLGVDLLETDGRLVVNETNARPTVDSATKYDDGFFDRLAGLIRETADSE
ncbi:RimK family alpha-L-glutamate ligase [Halobium salinum]|uniref:RimK family alpha-L-glutamate ligase n=1 Tax=Halobium salinum TaxID=1364940 RepID=A0ABD5PC16_9EURY|nr:RimK family alpha-L-glutamate ligase [Halobium salinum]